MVFFTTPELLEIGGLPFVTPYEKPTRAEALRYYRRVVDTFQLPIELGETVDRRSTPRGRAPRRGHDDRRRARGRRTARTVVIATGAYDLPNLLDIPARTCRTSRTITPRRTRTSASAW